MKGGGGVPTGHHHHHSGGGASAMMPGGGYGGYRGMTPRYPIQGMQQMPPSYPGTTANSGQFDYTAPEINYQHYRDYDFDETDRPMMFPHESYGKSIFPISRDTQESAPTKDWESLTAKFIPFVSMEAEMK